MIIEKLRTSLLRKILLCASIKIVNWPFQPTLMVIVSKYIIHSHLLQKLKPWSFLVWKNN